MLYFGGAGRGVGRLSRGLGWVVSMGEVEGRDVAGLGCGGELDVV